MAIKILLIVAIASLIGSVVSSTDFDSGTLTLPGRAADVWRVIVIAQAGLAVGFIVRIVARFFKVTKAGKDVLLRPMLMICVAYFGMVLYIGLDLASRIDFTVTNPGNRQYVTWRTPVAWILFLVSDVSLYQLMKAVSKMLDATSKQGSQVKLTLTEKKSGESTSVDLASGDVVTHK